MHDFDPDSIEMDWESIIPSGRLPAAGDQLGKYRLLREIASGAMGIVFEAHDPELSRTVAIKVLLDGREDGEHLQRFQREAELAARLAHPHIIRIHEIGQACVSGAASDPEHYIVMDLIRGTTLRDAIRTRSLEEKISLFEQVTDAMASAHDAGILHRDLKPENILVDEAGRAIVTDFGLARSEQADADTRLTSTEAVIGTAVYMAPEQILGQRDELAPQTDVWALGVILYELLTGLRPFEAGGMGALRVEVLEYEPGAPDQSPMLHPVPSALSAICMKALCKRGEDRYPDAGALHDEIRRWQMGDSVQAAPDSRLTRIARRLRRNPRWGFGAVLLVCLLVGVAGVGRMRSQRARIEQLHTHARSAAAKQDWDGALALCRRGLDIGDDARLEKLANACRIAIDRRDRAQASEKQASQAYRKLRPVLRGVKMKIQDARTSFYLAHVDIRKQLAGLEADVLGLEQMTADGSRSAEVWSALGVGWSVIGKPLRARPALERAFKLNPHDRWVQLGLGRLALEDALMARLHKKHGFRVMPESEERALWRQVIDVLKAQEGHVGGLNDDLVTVLQAMSLRNSQTARKLCRAGIRKYGRTPGVEMFYLVLSYICAFDKLLPVLNGLLRLRPRDAWAFFVRGIEYTRRGKIELALADYARGIRAQPYRWFLYNNRGAVRLRQRRYKEALADFDKAVACNPFMGPPYMNRAMLRMEQGRDKEALAHFALSIKHAPDYVEAHHHRSVLLTRLGRLKEALAALDLALAGRPADPMYRTQRGLVMLRLGQFGDAIADLQAALKVDRKNPLAWAKLARAYQESGAYAKAIEVYSTALALDQQNAGLWNDRGWCFEKLKQYAKAASSYASASGLDKSSTQYLNNLGQMLERSGRPGEARRTFSKAIKLDPQRPRSWFLRGNCRGRAGDIDGALKDFSQAIELDGKYSSAYVNRAYFLAQTGRTQAAIRDYRIGIQLAPASKRAGLQKYLDKLLKK